MKKFFIVPIIVCVLFSAVPVFAQSTYLALKGGFFLPNSDEEGLKDFDTGYNIEAAFGYKLNPNFAIEGGVGRYSSEYEEMFNVLWSDGSTTVETMSMTASAIPVTLTAKGIAPVADGQLELYGGAGIGYYLATIESEFIGVSFSWDGNAFGFHVVGGVDFNVSDKIAIGGEVKWFSVKPELEAEGYTMDAKMGGTIANAGVKFKF